MELDLQLCYICGWELVKGAEAEHISSQLWKSDRKSQISPLSPRRSIEQRNPELKCVICHHNETFPLLSASLYINQKIAAYTPLPPHTTLATHNNAGDKTQMCRAGEIHLQSGRNWARPGRGAAVHNLTETAWSCSLDPSTNVRNWQKMLCYKPVLGQYLTWRRTLWYFMNMS